MEEEIRKGIFKLQDKKYQKFHQNLCPGTENIIGVRVPVLRNYAKELLKKYDFNMLINEIGNNYYEEIMLQGMLIGLAKIDFQKQCIEMEKFIPKINNWAICDTFCAGLKSTKKNKEQMWKFIQKYLKSNKEFEIRFAVVVILDYYIEKDYLEKIYKIFDSIKSSDYYVQMAVAWAISICLIKFYDETIIYIKKSNLDNFVYQKALQKAIESYRISKEQKEYLRKMKKIS